SAPFKFIKNNVIEIFRDGYQHWAIYVGDGYVIHLVTACEVFCLFVITLKKEKLQDVAGNDKYRINNHLDDTYEPRPIEDILQEAERFHCATLVRYGNPQSKQVQFNLAAAALVFGILALATIRKKQNQNQ
uniref:LRAT domain-containing protein n=1 Tax=Cyprinus carpio TaxID=7962 RepID=A0A8C1LFZ7_CYPCA